MLGPQLVVASTDSVRMQSDVSSGKALASSPERLQSGRVMGVPIVLYVDGRSSWEWGGVPVYTLALAKKLVERGYTVAALCHVHGTERLREGLADLGVTVHAAEDYDTSLLGRARRAQSFAALLRQYPGCVLLMLMGYYWAGALVSVVGRVCGQGPVIRADLQPPMPPITLRDKLSVWFKDLFLDRIVVGAANNREAYVHEMWRPRRKFEVVHTGVDLTKFVPGAGREAARARLGYGPETPVVGTLARLSEERKGIRHFVEMAAQVARAFPNAGFLVVGDGLMRPVFERQAADLGVAERVRFAGFQPPAEMLAAMDVFVMPSLWEGGPMSVIEAMLMARPVVATSVGMVPEVIDHSRTGLIVPPADTPALVAAVSTLLRDPDRAARLGAAAREYAERALSLDAMVDSYLRVCADALGERASGRRGSRGATN